MGNNFSAVTTSILNLPELLASDNVAMYLLLLNGAPPMSLPFLILIVSEALIDNMPLLTVSTLSINAVLLVVAEALNVTFLIDPNETVLNGFVVAPSKTKSVAVVKEILAASVPKLPSIPLTLEVLTTGIFPESVTEVGVAVSGLEIVIVLVLLNND